MHLDRFFALKESGTDDRDLRSALDASKYEVENVDVLFILCRLLDHDQSFS